MSADAARFLQVALLISAWTSFAVSHDPMQLLVERLSSELTTLASRYDSLNQRLTRLESPCAERNGRNGTQVAFHAYMSHEPNVKSSIHSIIPFGGVITNVGNAYDPNTSVFTAPFRGEYWFFVRADITADYRSMEIYKNRESVAHCHNDGLVVGAVTCGAVLSLREGDTVLVKHPGSKGLVDAGKETTFSGFRIR